MADRTFPILEQVIKYFPSASHIYVTSTTGGTHSSTSLHYLGEAIDVSSASQYYKDELAKWLYRYSSHISELIHTNASNTAGWYVKNNVKVKKGFYGATLERNHINHVHLGVRTISQANALLAAAKGSSSVVVFPVLRSGATGEDVKTLQRALNAKGAKLVVDGNFGNATVAAVKAFQSKNGLASDGIVGDNTWAKLI